MFDPAGTGPRLLALLTVMLSLAMFPLFFGLPLLFLLKKSVKRVLPEATADAAVTGGCLLGAMVCESCVFVIVVVSVVVAVVRR